MQKIFRMILFCVLVVISFWVTALVSDRDQLNEELIRMHVVANSDSETDQSIKLQVRDAVLQSIQEDLKKISNVEEAKAYLQENIPKIQMVANETLAAVGFDGEAIVTLCKERFDTRYYETFSLPAGVYESLRIIIGEGNGKNWWCVAFPTLCIPATSEGFSDIAAGAGFSDTLSETLTGADGYEVRFYLLDALGRLENILFEG